MRTQTAPLIRLKDYSPPPYWIDDVKLTFDLHPDATLVTSTLSVRRDPNTVVDTPLRLDGDELTLRSLSVRGIDKDGLVYETDEDGLTISTLPKDERFKIRIETQIAPQANTKLMGLYRSGGNFCTQCEAEGFRRITYFLDRPDVLATYRVRLEADRDDCPILLSNGNPGDRGQLAGNRHFAEWHDPHPKPCYLFALVAGSLDLLTDGFTTASGRNVDLAIYVEKGKASLATYAMGALKRSMRWDEETYGREYDLDVFNIVAVSDFNMGAMENKGLNIFNDKYVLADETLATDTDFENIEAIVAHEYFHNWTGNRITCRDWFQLCLKEGLTVYRDQEFSADMRSRPVQRIEQVRRLKATQFPEDAGPLAHPVRPQSYREINNFYTATVYQKGAELVRMLATLVGPDGYRKAIDLYFERHDGDAARVEDFLACFAETSGRDLSQFSLWYEQAGTPVVTVEERYDEASRSLTLELAQETPATPGQPDKAPVVIPLRFGLIDANGNNIKPTSDTHLLGGDCILLDSERKTVTFEGLAQRPVVSLLRGFSAPITLRHDQSEADSLHKARFDSDPYARWSALNGLLLKQISAGNTGGKAAGTGPLTELLVEAVCRTVLDNKLDMALRAQILTLPSLPDLAQYVGENVDPDALAEARSSALVQLCNRLGSDGHILDKHLQTATEANAANRALKNALLTVILATGDASAIAFARDQYGSAQTMTDRFGALTSLVRLQQGAGDSADLLEDFYQRFEQEPLVVDKWFSLQATIEGVAGFERVTQLLTHEAYTLENPNRARSLLGPFATQNLSAFHLADGRGHTLFADQVLALDARNPQLAARLLTALNNWRIFEPTRRESAQSALKRIAETDGLSRDTSEIVERCLT
ncbi:MAG: aminopeptidase N [Ahrensia sp.]|nr:aminopeptidase N [Ahrensia sp.]